MSREFACHFEHAVAEAQMYREQAHALLDRLGLPPTPSCYAVAYDYVTRRTPALRKDLDRDLMRGRTPDLHLFNEQFERYFLTEQDADLDTHMAEISRVLFQVLEGVAQAGDGMCDFGQVLETQLEVLKTSSARDEIRNITRKMTKVTEKAITSNRQLQDNLQQAQRESEKLRRELVQVKEEANTDGLTGLNNRKAFNSALAGSTEQAAGDGNPLSLVLFDIDHFKRINDNYGHPIGDEVIRRVAAAVRKQVRGTDVAARYGGEEFAVLLPNTDLAGALRVAVTIHRAVGTLVLVLKASQKRLPSVTVSAGVASLREEDCADDLVERTDQALYFAKRTGRNRVISERQLGAGKQAMPG